MSKLYNPDLDSKEEIKKTFVGREKLLSEIVSIIAEQPKGAGVQHIILIAPRGMGKTTMLLMSRFSVEDSQLSETWQPVQFPEDLRLGLRNGASVEKGLEPHHGDGEAHVRKHARPHHRTVGDAEGPGQPRRSGHGGVGLCHDEAEVDDELRHLIRLLRR